MRNKWITFLMTLLVGSTVSYANANGQVTLEAGYRHDNLSWKNRFPQHDPIVKTHAQFKDIDIFQLGLRGSTTIGCNFYLRGQAYWGWVLDGNARQSVKLFPSFYGFSDASAGLVFDTDRDNVIDEKYVYGVGAAVGYPFYFCDCTLMLAPVIGYAVDEQNVWVEDQGFEFERGSGFFHAGSGNEYCVQKTLFRWYGPFVGLDFNYRPYCECWNIWGEIEYHWGCFNGKRHDRGFEFFDTRKHHSNDASGWVVALGADYELSDSWTVGFSLKFQDWSANHRRHHRGFSGGASYFFSDSFCDVRSQNNNKWNSYAVNLTVGKLF